MTELTPQEILDAIRRGLEKTARRFAKVKGGRTPESPIEKQPTDLAGDQKPSSQRQQLRLKTTHP
jgi:hypothetical protein